LTSLREGFHNVMDEQFNLLPSQIYFVNFNGHG
jgi:hypothetical protein